LPLDLPEKVLSFPRSTWDPEHTLKTHVEAGDTGNITEKFVEMKRWQQLKYHSEIEGPLRHILIVKQLI
jgi:hypothetical protein